MTWIWIVYMLRVLKRAVLKAIPINCSKKDSL